MKKRILFVIILLVSLAGLGLVIFFLSREEAKAPSLSASLKEEMEIDFIYNNGSASNIAFVTVRNNFSEYTMTGGENPVFTGYDDYPISIFYYLHFFEVSSRLVSQGFVTDEEANLSIFGLDPSRAQLFIQTNDGRSVTLLVGSVSPDNNIYVKLDNSPAVYLASYFDLSIFMNDFRDLVDTALTPIAQMDQDDELVFDRIVFGGQAREEIVIVKNDFSGNNMNFSMSPYRIISPLTAASSMEHAEMYESLFGLYADRFVAKVSDNSGLSGYGLSSPWSTLELVIEGESCKVLFSKPDNMGNVYACREGTSFIYEAASFNFPWLEITYFELMEKMVILPFIDSVASIDIKSSARTVSFNLSGAGGRLTVKSGNTDIDTGIFRVFYQNLLSARYDEYNDVPVNTSAFPFLEIIYNYRDRTKNADTVSFFSTDSRRVLTSLNSGRAHYTLSIYTDQLLSDLDRVLSGERIRSFL